MLRTIDKVLKLENLIMNNILVEQLRKHDLCKLFWSEQIAQTLQKEIILEYEPVGEMGVYSRQFVFPMLYTGGDAFLSNTKAILNLKITSGSNEYNLQKAMAGEDCFHNVQIKIIEGSELIILCRFRLWCQEEEEYTGKKSVLKRVLSLEK